MSRDSAQKIFETAKQTETNGFRLEDVLFLGIIREKAKMEIPHFEKVLILASHWLICSEPLPDWLRASSNQHQFEKLKIYLGYLPTF